MNKVSLILLLLIICACSSGKHKIEDGIEVIPVEVSKVSKDASSFIEKIELVPLETNDSSIFHKHKKVVYDKGMDIYAIYTRKQVVFTFSGKGRFIGNSKKVQGQGPDEYTMVLDMKFNPYIKGIDLLNPYGTIYTYSPTFELLSKRTIKPEFPINYLMALSPDDYIFTYPFLWTDQEVLFANLKTKEMNKASYTGTISGNAIEQLCFYNSGDDFYFLPTGLNYYFYRIDVEEKKLTPIMYLDFGDEEVKESSLPGRGTGQRVSSDDERSEIMSSAQERYRFVKESNHIIPLIKFFNDDYIYLYLAKTSRGYGGHYIFNRKTKEGFLLWDKQPFLMSPCFAITDNVLLSICLPYRVSEVVDRRFMSSEQINKMEQLKEDDNPVIIKYHLKK